MSLWHGHACGAITVLLTIGLLGLIVCIAGVIAALAAGRLHVQLS